MCVRVPVRTNAEERVSPYQIETNQTLLFLDLCDCAYVSVTMSVLNVHAKMCFWSTRSLQQQSPQLSTTTATTTYPQQLIQPHSMCYSCGYCLKCARVLLSVHNSLCYSYFYYYQQYYSTTTTPTHTTTNITSSDCLTVCFLWITDVHRCLLSVSN